MKLSRRHHLRVVEPTDPVDDCPPQPFQLPTLREVCARIARAAVITFAVIMAIAYLMVAGQLALQLLRHPDPMTALATALLAAVVLAIGIKVLHSLRYRPVSDGGNVVEHHVHHHHYNEGGQ